MLDCDVCHRWFHGACVGFVEAQALEYWACDECVMAQQLAEQQARYAARWAGRRGSKGGAAAKGDELERERSERVVREWGGGGQEVDDGGPRLVW